MMLNNLRKTEIWIYDITEPLEHDDFIMGEVEIYFTNGIFDKCIFPFKGLYDREKWDLLAQLSRKITEIEKQYYQQNTRGDYPCDATEHLPKEI